MGVDVHHSSIGQCFAASYNRGVHSHHAGTGQKSSVHYWNGGGDVIKHTATATLHWTRPDITFSAPYQGSHSIDESRRAESLIGSIEKCNTGREADTVLHLNLAAGEPNLVKACITCKTTGVVEPAVGGEGGVGNAGAVGADAKAGIGTA